MINPREVVVALAGVLVVAVMRWQVWKRRQEENGYPIIATIVIPIRNEHFVCIISSNSHSHPYKNNNHNYLNLPPQIVMITIFISATASLINSFPYSLNEGKRFLLFLMTHVFIYVMNSNPSFSLGCCPNGCLFFFYYL